MHCSQCKNGNSSSPFFFFLGKAGSVGWLIGIGIVSSPVSSDLFLFSVFVPLLVVVLLLLFLVFLVLFHLLCGFDQLPSSFSDAMCSSSVCHCYISVATTARRVGGKNIKIQRSRRFTCLSTEVLQTACLLQKVRILRERKSCLLVLHYGGCQLCYGEMTPSHEQVASFFGARTVSFCC